MKKGTLIFGALFAAMFAFSASAAEMIRYEYQYYKDGKKLQREAKPVNQEDRDFSSRRFNAKKVSKDDHPVYNHKGFMRDR